MVTFLLHPLCVTLTRDQLSSISFRVAIARKQQQQRTKSLKKTSMLHAAATFCLRRSLPQAYKPLFSPSQVQKIEKITNNLKKWYNTKLIGMLHKVC